MGDMSCEAGAVTPAESWLPAALADALCTYRTSASPHAHDALVSWLRAVRHTTEEYDTLCAAPVACPRTPHLEADEEPSDADSLDYKDLTLVPPSPQPPEDPFDDILSGLGREIFQLEEYQRRLAPPRDCNSEAITDSILDLFDGCLDEMTGLVRADLAPDCIDSSSATFETASPTVNDVSDGDSMLSEEALATSTPLRPASNNNNEIAKPSNDLSTRAEDALDEQTNDVNRIFAGVGGGGAPVPPKRRNRSDTLSSDSSLYDNMDRPSEKPRPASNVESLKSRLDSDSDSSSTQWSYRACSTDSEASDFVPELYAPVWGCSTGFHNSDDILYRVIKQNHAEESSIPYDTVSEMTLDQYTLYALPEREVGCDKKGASDDALGDVATAHTRGDRPEAPTPRCESAREMKPEFGDYEPVRDARDDDKYASVVTDEIEGGLDENIYEEIDYSYNKQISEDRYSYGSVEVLSCDESVASEDTPPSPLYANLRDNDAYAVGADVIAWKNLLLHPDFNDDEEDEWITGEESLMYAQEQRPPYIIPRITSYRAYRTDLPPHRLVPAAAHAHAARHHDELPHSYPEESLPVESPQLSMKDVRQMFEGSHHGPPGDWSPLYERNRLDVERAFSKASSDSPPLVRQNKRFGSNENLLMSNARRPNNYNLAASSGDSLELELRGPLAQERRHKSKSMVAARAHGKSPLPTPRAAPPPAHHSAETAEKPIFEEYVKRTKFAENGKKARKNWTDNYLVLTHTHMLFYKDMKAYHAALLKGSGAPPSPTGGGTRSAELVIPLQSAVVVKCTPQHTSRYARSIAISVGADQILIQDESPAGAAYWYDTIVRAINRLPGEFPHMEPSSSPSSGRKNSSRKVGDSSNEDLSDSAEHAKVRNKLRKFFTRRPTMEVLIKKGIYKDEPVFGRSLEEVCPGPGEAGPGGRVPEFVVRCVHEIESSEANMHTDGLYRASGNLSQVQKIRLEIDQNNLEIVEQNSDVHVLTGSLKLFFRELKEPLIPCKLFNRILAATGIKNREARIKEFRDIVNSLPQCNWDTLKFILEHLLRVTEHAAQNRMHIANLAIVFGPTLLWAPAELAHNIAVDCIQQNHAIEILLTDFHHIFTHDRHKKKS